MFRADLAQLLINGESSGLEFKRDDIRPERLATEICALLNLNGGRILLGVEDEGTVTGLTRSTGEAEEWVMNICRENVQPPLIPFWETVTMEDGKVVGIVELSNHAPDKPYKTRHGSAWVTYIRVGTTSRQATREEEQRLYQTAGQFRYETKPVAGTSMDDLDMDRLINYIGQIRDQSYPPKEDVQAWETQLSNLEFVTADQGRYVTTIGGLLLFGNAPKKFLPQAGITATAYQGVAKDYDTVDDAIINGPLVPIVGDDKVIREPGIIDKAVEFVMRNMGTHVVVDGARRESRGSYPADAIREGIVNAVAHRDYSIQVTDIEIALYANRLEILSPGGLPNTVTIDKMKTGFRASRNELIKDVLRDYNYIEHRGMGIPYKIIRGLQEYNQTEPDLVADDDRFLLRFWKNPIPEETESNTDGPT